MRCLRKDVMLRHYRNKHGIRSLKRRDAVPQTEGYTPLPRRRRRWQKDIYRRHRRRWQRDICRRHRSCSSSHILSFQTSTKYSGRQKNLINNPYTFYVPDGSDPDHFMPRGLRKFKVILHQFWVKKCFPENYIWNTAVPLLSYSASMIVYLFVTRSWSAIIGTKQPKVNQSPQQWRGR